MTQNMGGLLVPNTIHDFRSNALPDPRFPSIRCHLVATHFRDWPILTTAGRRLVINALSMSRCLRWLTLRASNLLCIALDFQQV